MSKILLTPQEVSQIMTDYLQALGVVKGHQVEGATELTYKKGWFYLRPAGHSREAARIPYKPKEIREMTEVLRKQIPWRADQEDDGYPD